MYYPNQQQRWPSIPFQMYFGLGRTLAMSLHIMALAVRAVCPSALAENLPVKKIAAGENYVRASAVAGEGLGSWNKGGVNQWHFRVSNLCKHPTSWFIRNQKLAQVNNCIFRRV
jgi:hypothetical protein